MNISSLEQCAFSGDILLARSNKFVRIFSAESFSHVAVLVKSAGNPLAVYEFVEGVGYQCLPLGVWLDGRKGQTLYYGTAPLRVRNNPQAVYAAAGKYRDGKAVKRMYGWLSLVTVWAAQITGLRIPVWAKVCSTFVQEVWEAAGYRKFKQTADPGDFVAHCEGIYRIGEDL